MDLHERLRALASQLGSDIFTDADGFRGALDDYLDEGAASRGDINLLVDAVRLDALRRLLTMIEHGADPSAAVLASGEQLARDRGSDDLVRSCWACAALGFALGKVGEVEVLRHQTLRPDPRPAGSTPQPPVAAPQPPLGAPALPGPAESSTQPIGQAQAPAPYSPAPYASPPYTPVIGPGAPFQPTAPRRRRRTALVLTLAAAAAVVAAGAAAIWLVGPDTEPDTNVGRDPDQSPTGQTTTTTDAPDRPAIPESDILLSATSNGVSRIVRVNVTTGEQLPLTNGPEDVLPAISPDRDTVIYLKKATEKASEPYVLDASSGEQHRLFETGGECTYSTRPAWNISGTQLAVVCQEADGTSIGLYVVGLDGQVVRKLPTTGELTGAPTWMSDETLVYTQAGAGDSASTLWEIGANGESLRQLTNGVSGWDSHPDWSEERGLLLFSRHQTEDVYGDIWTMDESGTLGEHTDGLLLGHPVWSPDGREVAYTIKEESGEPQLWVSPLDQATDPRLVTGIEGTPGVPVWASR